MYFFLKCFTNHLTGTNLTSISEIMVLSSLLSSQSAQSPSERSTSSNTDPDSRPSPSSSSFHPDTWSTFLSSLSCDHELTNSPSIHFWERNSPALDPCSQKQPATCICCCPQYCTLQEILAVYQSSFPFRKAKQICLNILLTEHPPVSSPEMFPTLHLMTAQASPRPPFRGCFSV